LPPSVAAIVVAHESARDLPETLARVRSQLEPGDELVVVDNASRDDGAAVAGAAGATVLRLERNAGFAGGASAGADATEAELLFFLNPDARLAPGALAALREAAAARPAWGAWQALVLLPGGEQINTAGNVAHWLGLGWAGECDRPVAVAPTAPCEVGFASGAALVVRRAAWEAAGGFEPGYFMYGEDLDLSLRLRLAGWGVGTVPAARVEHDYEFVKGEFKWFHLERNRWWTVLTAYPPGLLALVLPALLASEAALIVAAATGGWLRAKLRSQVAVLRSLPWTLRRRAQVQAARRVSAGEFAAALSDRLDSPYLGDMARRPGVVRGQAAYWALVRRALRVSSRSA
jgi:GT2 family glycosyltransferase